VRRVKLAGIIEIDSRQILNRISENVFFKVRRRNWHRQGHCSRWIAPRRYRLPQDSSRRQQIREV